MIEAKMIDREFFIQKGEDGNKLYEEGYGIWSSNGLKLSPVEALYLVEREKIVIKDIDNNILSFKDILKMLIDIDEKIWLRYLIYSDLRKRGFWVKPGFSSEVEFLASESGRSGIFNYIVVGLEEGVKLSFKDLTSIINEALRSSKELILAIVDKEGNISYYTVTKLIR